MPTLIKSEIIASREQDLVARAAECLVKFMNVNYLKTMLVCNEEEHTKEVTHDVLSKLTELKKSSNSFNVVVYTCGQKKCNANRNFQYEQYFVFANSVTQLNFILTKCICSKWPSTARMIVITNQIAYTNDMLDVLKKNLIFKALLVTSWKGSHISFRHAKPRCPQIRYFNSTFLYDCSLNTNYQSTEFNLQAVTKCNLRLGVRLAPPYVEKLDNKTAKKYNQSNPYVGIELIFLYAMTDFNHKPFTVSEKNEIGEYDDDAKVGFGLIKELVDGDVDLIVGALHNIDNHSYAIDASYPLIYANLIGIVKKRVEPGYFKLVKVFHWTVWLVVLILVVLLVFVTYLITYHNHYESFSCNSTLFSLFAVLIAQEGSMNQKYLRLVLMSWIWIAFMLRSSYEAYSTLLFINKDAIVQVDQLGEICKDNYKTFVPVFIHAYFSTGYQLPGCHIPPENFIPANDSLKELVNTESDFVAVFLYRYSYLADLIKFIGVGGHDPLHVIKEAVALIPLFKYFRRGDPLLDIFRKWETMASEIGLFDKYQNIVEFNRKRELYSILRNFEENQGLALKHVTFIFYIYMCGAFVSIVVFGMELIYSKYVLKAIK